jgi:hypothetical protein
LPFQLTLQASRTHFILYFLGHRKHLNFKKEFFTYYFKRFFSRLLSIFFSKSTNFSRPKQDAQTASSLTTPTRTKYSTSKASKASNISQSSQT